MNQPLKFRGKIKDTTVYYKRLETEVGKIKGR